METFGHVLLIDDDPVSIFLNKQTLRKAGIDNDKILVAHSGLDGLKELIRSDIYHDISTKGLIFLDINMPVVDGFEFLLLYKQMDFINKDNIVIVILTSSSDTSDIERSKTLGIRDYITKPLTVEKVKKILIL